MTHIRIDSMSKIKKAYLRSMFLLSLFFMLLLRAGAQDFPATPNRLVNDYTNTLNSTQVQELERKLLAFEDSTSIQIAVVVMNTTGDYDIADYAVRLGQKWGVGNKKYNNGILLLVALGDRAVTIQTGYGIEGAVPDAIAYRIIENEIKPAFRQRDYYTGIDRATSALISYTKGEYRSDPSDRTQGQPSGGGILKIIIFVVIVIIVLAARKGGGGGGNGGGRVIGGRGANDLIWWTLLNGMLGGGGRGGSSGGDFGGGGGGGFGGFGGGGFGGGGASGRW
ncbi:MULTISPECIES: TPM domain-containing protein [unclassified Sphingobacterium]|uniref:TPM domain-containing protein n=1 Tax=unclassified Sphingobacterium TaxID=2609468 RepID=UPI0025EF07BF|nr:MULTISPECIES: TPM domain-containing protein [unclassified Sphingobacterium]